MASQQREPTATNGRFLELQFDTQLTYNLVIKATFIELPPFERTRKDYMDDEAYRFLQLELMKNPTAGDVMEGTDGDQFWLFTVYDKDQADDLTPEQRKVLKQLLKNDLKNRHPEDGEHL